MKQPSSYKVTLRCMLTWLLFIPVAIVNGIVRERLYKPFTGDLAAHQISTVVACSAYLILARSLLKDSFKTWSTRRLFVIGFMWVLMTILFEFGFGRSIVGTPWNKLLHDYNILKGRIWVLFLLTLFFTPWIIKSLAKQAEAKDQKYQLSR